MATMDFTTKPQTLVDEYLLVYVSQSFKYMSRVESGIGARGSKERRNFPESGAGRGERVLFTSYP